MTCTNQVRNTKQSHTTLQLGIKGLGRGQVSQASKAKTGGRESTGITTIKSCQDYSSKEVVFPFFVSVSSFRYIYIYDLPVQLLASTRVYGKAGNGNEMETGNGNWKWKQRWKHNVLTVVVLARFNCCWFSFLGVPVLSLPPVFALLAQLAQPRSQASLAQPDSRQESLATRNYSQVRLFPGGKPFPSLRIQLILYKCALYMCQD